MLARAIGPLPEGPMPASIPEPKVKRSGGPETFQVAGETGTRQSAPWDEMIGPAPSQVAASRAAKRTPALSSTSLAPIGSASPPPAGTDHQSTTPSGLVAAIITREPSGGHNIPPCKV